MLKKARILILVVMTATVMLLGSTAVFAVQDNQNDGGDPSSTVPKITKKVTLPEGVTLPATNFVFKATKTTNADGVAVPTSAPASFETTISGTQTVGTADTASTAPAEFKGDLDIPDSITGTVGEYTYELAETAPTQGGNWKTIDTTKYYLHVYVKNDKSVLYSITDTNSLETAKKTDPVFNNEYKKEASLEVSKTVINPDYVDKTLDYTFKITFTTNGSSVAPDEATGTVTKQDGTTTSKTVENGSTFTLKAGEKIVFTNLPVGVKYTLEETPTPTDPNYTSTAIDVTKGTSTTTVNKAIVENQLIGEDTNKAEVKNTFKEVTLTGIVTTYLPYIAMILLAMAALALYVVSKRRRAARY